MTAKEVAEALAAPFDANEVKFKPQMVKNNRALAVAYIDARLVQDRLDEVLGVAGWQDDYEITPDGSVVCRLRLDIGGEWVTKMDVGSPSEQPDGGDRLKAAFSDALKRAAVKFGVGRYLYGLPLVWHDYDPVRRQFTSPPRLPAQALPPPQTIVRRDPPRQLAVAPAEEPPRQWTPQELGAGFLGKVMRTAGEFDDAYDKLRKYLAKHFPRVDQNDLGKAVLERASIASWKDFKNVHVEFGKQAVADYLAGVKPSAV